VAHARVAFLDIARANQSATRRDPVIRGVADHEAHDM